MSKSNWPWAIVFSMIVGCANAPRDPAPAGIETPRVSSGTLDIYTQFESRFVAPRTVYVWLPDGYSSQGRYDVVYMHDGQMLFDPQITWNNQEWGVDEVAGRLQAERKTRDFIVVGIDNGAEQRWSEYFPERARDYLDEEAGMDHEFSDADLLADEYLEFLVTELKPFIDGTYSVNPGRDSTFTLGSSMGGLISLYAISEYPMVFGGAACISTHWPGIDPGKQLAVGEAILAYMGDKLPPPTGHRIYFDHGTATLDAHYPPWQARADQLMEAGGYTAEDWLTRSFDGAEHNEDAWRDRLHIPLEFLLGSSSR